MSGDNWQTQGRPDGPQQHRCQHWARLIGGILQANGLGGCFLENVADASMDEGLQALATLAEHLMARPQSEWVRMPDAPSQDAGKLPGDWAVVFVEADLYREQLGPKNARARATWVGQFLGAKVDRQVTITVADRMGTATLRKRELRARQKAYYFEIAWTVDPDAPPHSARETSDRSGAGWPARPEPATPKTDPAGHAGAAPSPAAQGPDVNAADSIRPAEPAGNDLPWD